MRTYRSEYSRQGVVVTGVQMLHINILALHVSDIFEARRRFSVYSQAGDVVCEIELEQFSVGVKVETSGFLAKICESPAELRPSTSTRCATANHPFFLCLSHARKKSFGRHGSCTENLAYEVITGITR